jgi:hypothetical protein
VSFLRFLIRMILRVLTTLCLCLQVILAFGSLWIFFMSLAGQVPAMGWLQYPLGLFALIGGFAILFPEFCALGALTLLPTWGLFLMIKVLSEGNTFLEISMFALTTMIAMVQYNQIRQIIRTKTLGDFPVFKDAWVEKGASLRPFNDFDRRLRWHIVLLFSKGWMGSS